MVDILYLMYFIWVALITHYHNNHGHFAKQVFWKVQNVDILNFQKFHVVENFKSFIMAWTLFSRGLTKYANQ